MSEEIEIELEEPAAKEPENDGPSLEDLEALARDDEQKPKTVPHSRFNQVNEELKRERAERAAELAELRSLKEQLDALKKPAKEEKTVDLDELHDQYEEAMYAGDKAASKRLRKQIEDEKERRLEAKAEERAKALLEKELKKQKEEFDKAEAGRTAALVQVVVDEAYEKYPFLDNNGDDPNVEAIEEVQAMAAYHVGKGKAPAEALRLAVNKVAPRYADEKEDPIRKTASIEDIRKNLDRDAKQPPRSPGVGQRQTGKLKLEELSSKEWAALTEEQKAKYM